MTAESAGGDCHWHLPALRRALGAVLPVAEEPRSRATAQLHPPARHRQQCRAAAGPVVLNACSAEAVADLPFLQCCRARLRAARTSTTINGCRGEVKELKPLLDATYHLICVHSLWGHLQKIDPNKLGSEYFAAAYKTLDNLSKLVESADWRCLELDKVLGDIERTLASPSLLPTWVIGFQGLLPFPGKEPCPHLLRGLNQVDSEGWIAGASAAPRIGCCSSAVEAEYPPERLHKREFLLDRLPAHERCATQLSSS